MSSQNFELLGNYIQPCNERNVDCIYGADELRGINNEGKVIPSKANLVGVSFHTYKIAHKGDFIYNPARLDIGSISCLQEESAIFSQMYVVFKVREEYKDVLLTEYLWLWLKRENFFRYVAFINFGSVREMFTYEDMCNVMLPVPPPIAEQRRIVSEYQTVERRIANNEALIQKLEETAQAIYHHTFVEGIDEEKLPEGWRMGTLGEIAEFKVGGDKPSIFSAHKTEECRIPIYSNGVDDEGLYGFTNKPSVTQPSVTISARGNVGTCFLRRKPYSGIVRLVSVIPQNENFLYYLLWNLSRRKLEGDGSAQSQITVPQLKDEDIIIPSIEVLNEYHRKEDTIFDYLDLIKAENLHLRTLLTLLTSKLA